MHRIINYIIITYVIAMFLGGFTIRKVLKNKVLVYAYYLISAVFMFYFVWSWNNQEVQEVWDHHKRYSIAFLLSWLLFMVVLSAFWAFETIFKVLLKPFRIKNQQKLTKMSKIFNIFGFLLALFLVFAMFYGILYGKYDFRVIKHTIYFKNLPKSFDGYQITHISDIHSGSFDNEEKVKEAIDLINEQKSNAVFFTGDIVNDKATELLPWKDIFSQIKAPDGVFSVLGNHDYGDYVKWFSLEAKQKNLKDLIDIQKEMGFNLLLNEHQYIKKNDEKIAIVGVENWGKGFIQKGDLKKALEGISEDDFKILLSHDPTHWEEEVIDNKPFIDLTLSGHTHGMQFGLEIGNLIKFSPIELRYKRWGGIYTENQRVIHINRGLGFLAFPGRVGMPPEISVIELKCMK